MARRFQITVSLIAVLAVACVALLRVVIDQRNSIAVLRADIDSRAPTSLSESPVVSQTGEAPPPTVSDLPPPAPVVSIAEPPKEAATSSVALGALQQENQRLEARLHDAEALVADAKKQIGEPDDTKSAYVGPGTWMTADNGPITKLVISGKADYINASRMTIQVWGKCSPTDCEWGEVPFFLLMPDDSPKKYFRGFARWDVEGSAFSRNLIVTFEKDGLKIDCISIANQSWIHHRSLVRTMKRINY